MIGEVGIIASANSRSKWSWWGRDAVTKPPAYGWPLMVHVEEATERREGRGLIEMKLMDTPVVTADRVMKSVVFWRENLGETTSWADMPDTDGMVANVASTVLFVDPRVGVEMSVVMLTTVAADPPANWTSTAHTMLGDGVNAETNSRTRWS